MVKGRKMAKSNKSVVVPLLFFLLARPKPKPCSASLLPMDDDTPRSYASPRDDRFFTPRTIARSNSATSNSDEWNSPRDYQTPRTYDTDRKDSGRLSQRSNGSKDGGVSYGGGPAVDVRGYYANSYDQYQYQTQPRPQAQAKASERDEKQFADEAAAVSSSSSAHVSEQDIEDIFSFTRHGRAEEIERLLSKGIPVDIRDAFGNTLLIIACQNGNKRITKALLRRGANINARNYKGNTPLHYCYHCKPPPLCPCMPWLMRCCRWLRGQSRAVYHQQGRGCGCEEQCG